MLNNIVGFLGEGVAASTNSYESIATVTVGAGGSSSISFTSIPSTYKHLQVRAINRSDRSAATYDSVGIRFNSDSGNSYAYHLLYGDGSAAAASAQTNYSYMFGGYASAANATANVFNVNVIDILDYTNTNKYTTIRNLTGVDTNGAGYIWLTSGLWMNTNAVTSLTLLPVNGTIFTQHSHFALYGVKG